MSFKSVTVKRLIGSGLIIIGLFGVVLSIAGIIAGRQVVDSLGQTLAATLAATQTNLTTVTATLQQTKSTLKTANQLLQTTQQTILDASQTLSQTQPVLDQASQIASQEIPDSLNAVQATLPNIAATTRTVETTLTRLSDFELNESFLGRQLSFDLGIDYEQPQPPIDQSLAQMETNLGQLADSFRPLEKDLQVTSQNIALISQDLETLGQNLGQVNQDLAGFDLLLDDYLSMISDFQTSLEPLPANLPGWLAQAKLGLTLLLVWLGLTNLVPLYLGWELWRPGQSLS